MNNPLEAVTQAVNSLVTALKLPDESAKANEVLGEMSFPQFSRLLPYRDYNQESGLFMNDTTMGFMLEAIPINGANESIVEALDHMLRTKLPRGIPLCIHLMSSQLVGDRIEYGLREFSWSGEQAERFNAITRAYYMKAAATQFPLPEGMNLPLTLRHYHPGNPAGYCPANEGGTMRCRGLIALLIWGQSVAAADLGTWGDLWPVKEPDMLTVIMQRLTALEQSGEMGRKMDAFKERVIRNSLRPPAVPGIGRTEKYGSRLFDPSVRLAADIRDNEGRVFARQGEVMNPLQYVPFNQTLYFINGDDPAQVAWMKRQTPPTLESKIILVQGSTPEMQKSLDSRVYFDQNGVLCQRLGIDQVPARVSAVPGDRFLKVEFIPAEEGRK